MKFSDNLLFFTIFVFLIMISSGIVFAEDSSLPSVETGEVSGDIEIASENPFATGITEGNLVYEIPENVSEIKSAYVVVNSYSGSGKPTFGLTTNVSLKAGNSFEVLEYADLIFVNDTTNDQNVYPVTDFTSKQYSDYQTLVDITDNVKGLSAGDTITITVKNTELDGYSFDGRIKLITLIFAYNDDDNDKISYWLNIGQAWTKGTLSTIFNTKDFEDDYDDVTLEAISLSSADASYKLNGEALVDPIREKGNNYICDVWDITDNFGLGVDTNFTYTSSDASAYSSYKGVIQLLKINTLEAYSISATMAPEYKYDSAVYAGVENTLKVTINNGNQDFNGSVILLIGDEEVASSNLTLDAGESAEIKLIDTTCRPVDEITINGANNTLVNYTLNIVDAEGNVLNSTNVSYKVLYNGYLGKDKEYPGPAIVLREISFTGDYFYLTTDDYSAGGATNRKDEYDVDLMGGTVNTAFLYVPYNWDKNINGDFNTWNTTFNNQIISPIASYRDQSNLGSSGKYGYGLVVYDVSDLVVDGINAFEFNKTAGNVAVYPTNLIILTNNDESTFKTAYILEEADLLSTDYNKNIATSFLASFSNVIDGNATLYVFAASAQSGEGDLMINSKTYTDVWSGTSQSLEMFMADVDVISNIINVHFKATGSTILGLHQMVVVESEFILVNNDLKPEYSGTIYAGVENNLTLTVTNEASNLENITVDVLLNGDELESYGIDSLGTGESKIIAVIDPTIRPVTENTVNGNKNEKVNYTVTIKDAEDNIIDEANYTFVVLYDGNLGKEYEYPNANPLLREYNITGHVVVAKGSQYAGSSVDVNDVIAVAFEGDVVEALLYVSYNWNNPSLGDFTSWNITFNNKVIAPIASYKDQGNLGNYGKYDYGLVVYNVTGLVVNGENALSINRTPKNVAIYPASLLVLTNESSLVQKTVYILEEVDLLSKTNNKNLPAGFDTAFDVIDGNATLYVFAASAQEGEGNLIVNGETYTDVWKGSSQSVESFITDVDAGNIKVYFESTGATILALHQIVVVENQMPKKDLTLNATVFDIFGNATLIISGFENATGNVTITIGDEIYTTPIMMGVAFLSVPKLNETVTAYIYYSGDDNYNNASTTVDIIAKKNLNLTASADPIYVGQNATLIVTGFENATGNVMVMAGRGFYNATIVDGAVTVTIPGLNQTTAAYVIYLGDDNYNMAYTGVNITVNPKENATISIDAPSEATEGDNVTVTVTLPKDAAGSVTIGNGAVPVVNGTASAVLTNVPVGNNTIPITYSGDDKYNPIETSVNISVKEDTSDIISAPDVTKYFHGSERFVVTVTDSEGTPLANKSVSVVINGVPYSRTTNANGTTSIPLGLPAGVYNVTTTVDNQTVDSVVSILATVNGTDIVKVFRNATQYYATFLDSEGNYLPEGTEVTFNINGVIYIRKVTANGLAKLNINLEQGEYIITAINNVTGEMSSNKITVIPRIVENNDLTKYFRNASQYTVKLIGDDGNPVGAGENVTFNINGVMYTRTTNASGIAKLNINLNSGDYVITTEYKGCKVSNNIKVLPILTGKDITMKYRDGTKFVATLVDGQGKPYEGQTIQFNINGVFYNRVTDSTGQAKLNINLMAGQYIITSSYNGASTSNTITITA